MPHFFTKIKTVYKIILYIDKQVITCYFMAGYFGL